MPRLIVTVPDERLVAGLAPLPDDVEMLVWMMDSPAPREHIDIVVPPYMSTRVREGYAHLSGVRTRLVQSMSIGYENLLPVLPPGHTLANAASVHEASTAELALALALAAQREVPGFVRAQDEGRWAPVFASSLADRRVLLLGYGGVGRAIARRIVPFEVALTVVAHRAREEDGIRVHAATDLPALLPDAEILIAALPGGEETTHLVDDAVLSLLPDGALVVNVGRGPAVDTDALVDHVRRGRIRAALDVTDPEPLPPGHPLWTLPGVLISPHVGGGTTAMIPRTIRLIRTQIERMLAGVEPLNVVVRG